MGIEEPTPWRSARDILLGLVPAMYVFGFLAWATHFHRLGLGFHQLQLVSYLTAGSIGIVALSGLLLAEILIHRWVIFPAYDRELRRTWGTELAAAGLRLLLGTCWLTLLMIPLDVFNIVEFAPSRSPLASFIWPLLWFGTVLLGVVLHLVALGIASGTVAVIRWFERLGERLGRGSTLTDSEPSQEISLPFTRGQAMLGSVMVIWFALMVYAFGWLVVPAMQPEFGGGMARTAQFAMDPADLPATLQGELYGNQTLNSTAAWTNTLTVFVETDQYFIVRGGYPASADGRLIQIPTSQVHAVHWIGRFEA